MEDNLSVNELHKQITKLIYKMNRYIYMTNSIDE